MTIERYTEIEFERYPRLLAQLTTAPALRQAATFCAGSTFMGVDEIAAAGRALGARLLRCRSAATGFWALVPLPKPKSFAFVLDDPRRAAELFHKLDAHAVFDFVSPSPSVAAAVEAELSRAAYRRKLPMLEADDGHFIYGVDTDDASVESGIVEYLALGPAAIDRVPELRLIP